MAQVLGERWVAAFEDKDAALCKLMGNEPNLIAVGATEFRRINKRKHREERYA